MDGAPYTPTRDQEGCPAAEAALSQVGKAKVIWKQLGEHLNAVEMNLRLGVTPVFNADLADRGADRLHSATIALAAQVRRTGKEGSL